MKRQLVRASAISRERLVFHTEQAMLPLEERTCLYCVGRGCGGCERTGKLFAALKRYTGSDVPNPAVADSDHFKNWLSHGHFNTYWEKP